MAEDLVTQQYIKLAKEQADLFQSCGAIMNSDYGEDLVKLINALNDGFKNQGLFADDEKERWRMQGAVISLQTLLSQIAEFASRDKEIGEEDVKVKDMIPGYVTLGEDDEL